MPTAFRTALTVLTLGSATLATVGCDRQYEIEIKERRDDTAARPAGEVERTAGSDRSGAGPIDKKTSANAPTIRSIAMARCDREATCNNLGAGKKFGSRDLCMTEITRDLGDDLSFAECPGGVVQKELDECLAEIKNEDCNNPIDKMERLAACRESDLCKAVIN